MPLECFLIADDLTGACDAAVHFAVRGHQAAVCLDSAWPESGVLAISTASRELAADHLRRIMAEIARRLPAVNPRILFKKIDSTLRGSVGVEVEAALEAFGCDVALITPAFPAMLRTVESGWLRVGGAVFEPIDLTAYWQKQGLASCRHVPPAALPEAIRSGARLLSVDATCDADLDAIAVAGLASGRCVLWAGSGGLSSALARTLPQLEASRPPWPLYGAVLFCIGSDHPVTLGQVRHLLANRPALFLSAETGTPEALAAALSRGEHVVLQIPRGRVSEERLSRLVDRVQIPLLLSGGDTAALVCRAVGARRIVLADEIVAGIPRGILEGGPLDRLPVATKSGGFGRPDALVQVADFFTCPKP
jgi:uncharacterized protein YgbK (DUF1537 family)